MEFYCGQDGNLIWKLDVAKMTLFVADMTRRFSFWPICLQCCTRNWSPEQWSVCYRSLVRRVICPK